MHLVELAYQFIELVIQNFLQDVELAVSIFSSYVKAELDILKNSLHSQIWSVWAWS
jgi:hypothetical protein